MILYFASYKNSEEIEAAVLESNKPVMEKKVVSDFDFLLFIKQQSDSLKTVDVLILDISAFSNSDDDILMSLRSYRMLYEKSKIIIIATKRDRGDRLLSEVFCLGIYDIIAGDMEKSQLKEEISYSITYGKSIRESLVYKDEYVPVEDKTNTVRERIVIKNEIRPAVNKAFIGFIGTQARIGTTHNAVVCANYLRNKGFKIAIIEDQNNENHCFDLIRKSFDCDIEEGEEYFKLYQVDYYPNFDMANIFKILTRKYNFVLIDFGIFNIDKIVEFNRCVIPIIVTGSKAWEINHINNVFSCVAPDDLKEYTYLFNYTGKEDYKNIKEEMGDLKKVYISSFEADPFKSTGYDDLDDLFKGYVPETVIKQKRNSDFWGGIKCRLKFSK